MKNGVILVIVVLAVVVGIAVLSFAATGYGFAMFRFWAPKYENVKREVFENTQSYVQGKVSYLTTLQLSYATATGDERKALRTTILREASTIPAEKLPGDLAGFINGLKGDAR